MTGWDAASVAYMLQCRLPGSRKPGLSRCGRDRARLSAAGFTPLRSDCQAAATSPIALTCAQVSSLSGVIGRPRTRLPVA